MGHNVDMIYHKILYTLCILLHCRVQMTLTTKHFCMSLNEVCDCLYDNGRAVA